MFFGINNFQSSRSDIQPKPMVLPPFESSRRDDSNEWSHHTLRNKTFRWEIKKLAFWIRVLSVPLEILCSVVHEFRVRYPKGLSGLTRAPHAGANAHLILQSQLNFWVQKTHISWQIHPRVIINHGLNGWLLMIRGEKSGKRAESLHSIACGIHE